jgi:hypothetical protein
METNVIMLTPKWEYRKETNLTMEELTEMGQDGWELIGYSIVGTLKCYIFKRPVYNIPERQEV